MASRQPGSSGGGGGHLEPIVGNYKTGSEIGRGSFATVFKAHHMETGSLAAIKVVQRAKLNRKLLENLESEIQILKKLNHSHIVALTDCRKTDKFIYLIMEYCSVGDLSVIIRKRENLEAVHPCLKPMAEIYPSIPSAGLHEVVARHFVKQLASALEYLRKDGLVHRDVKPQNLLLNPPPDYEPQTGEGSNQELVGLSSLPVLKLADFGFARVLPATSMAETLCGSPLYMAPEILRYEKYDATADLWSVGTVLYEMVVGRPPFRAPNHVDLLRRIESRNDRIDFGSHCQATPELKDLVRGLLKRSPVERMSFQEFFDHPIIKGDIPGAAYPNTQRSSSRRGADIGRMEMEMRRTPSSRPAVDNKAFGNEQMSTKAHISSSPKTRTSMESSALPFANPNIAHAPHRFTDMRRASTLPPTPPSPVREQLVRPGIIAHATAPARQGLLADRQHGTAMERISSRDRNLSPGSSLLVQQDREREQQLRDRFTKRAVHENQNRYQEREEDRIETDYVVVDKQAVQVNAFADELAVTARRGGLHGITPPSSSNALSRRPTTNTPPSRAISMTGRRDTAPHQKSSYEMRISSSPSPGRFSLARALELANHRLFGGSVSPPSHSPRNMQQPFPPYPSHGSLIMIGNNAQVAGDDMNAVQAIEDAASRSDVVYHFAEVKYAQLMPANSSAQGLGLISANVEDASSGDMDLTPDATVQLAEEALVLFVKALSLLATATQIGGTWWAVYNSRNESPTPALTAVSQRMNSVVQWVRERFNEVLEKAEIVRVKLLEAQKELPANHPSHPSNHPDNFDGGLGGSDRVIVTPGVTAEKLMYDRALEMSRAAAVNELVGEDLAGCEVAYVTSIRMLEAVVEKDTADGEDSGCMEDEDKVVVEKFMNGIRGRLQQLRNKMDVMSKRSSGVYPMHTSPPQPSSSPGPTGISPR
ncbi:Serine/threonine-protein kinase [Rhizina undulata]